MPMNPLIISLWEARKLQLVMLQIIFHRCQRNYRWRKTTCEVAQGYMKSTKHIQSFIYLTFWGYGFHRKDFFLLFPLANLSSRQKAGVGHTPAVLCSAEFKRKRIKHRWRSCRFILCCETAYWLKEEALSVCTTPWRFIFINLGSLRESSSLKLRLVFAPRKISQLLFRLI